MARRGGYTLIELLTVVAIFGMISIYVGQLLMLNERAYQNVDQTSASQQSLRAAMEILGRDLRHTGMMVPPIVTACGVDETDSPDRLYLTDAAAIDPQDDVTGYTGAQITGVTDPGTGAPVSLQLDSLIIEAPTVARAAYDTDGNGANDSDFRLGGGAIVADLNDPSRGTACGDVTVVDLANDRITVDFHTDMAADGGGAQLVAVPAVGYRVNNGKLFWNGNLLADGLEDLQVAYIFDVNGDNVIDAGDIRGVTGANYDSQDLAGDLLREIRVNLVARNRLEDPDFGTGQLQRTENRSAVGVVVDGFRRRVLTSRVRLRNSGERMSVL